MEQENFEYKDQKIIDVHMEKEVKNSFINYAMSVIVSRALPDVRDGLKPVHRRILYAMYEDSLTYNNPYRKSATTVGNVLGRYHPHGDAAVYDSMVRLAQPFSMRYTLVDGQGNFGNIDGDQAAAYRYTEARLTRMANDMMTDIEKDVVDFAPNFDNKLQEPTVLPSRFPNLLVNGSVGIAVGMATNIPPHNLNEVIDGAIYLMDNPDCEITDLMEIIKGPDFPTSATICGSRGIYDTYTTGHGKIIVRAKAEVDEDKRRIIITEIPYQVNKQMLVEAMANCHKDKRIEGITDLRDETGKDGMRIVVEYRRDANGQVILNQLYKYTQLQDTFAANMLAIVNGVPKVLNLKEMLEHYVAHQQDVVERRVKYDLAKAVAEMHIFEGYKIAIDHIDEIIKMIRSSESIPDARQKLIESFGLSEAQAQAIVEMPLGRLSGMERNKIEERLAKLCALVADLEAILADETKGKIKQIIKDDMIKIKERFGDERRTELVPMEEEIVYEDLIEKHTCVISLTHEGYIKRQNSDVYSAQRRGGKGIIGTTTKEEDFVEKIMAVDSHSYLLLFTTKGKIYTTKAYAVPESGRTSKGTYIANLLELDDGEKVTAMISVSDFGEEDYLLFVTKKGTVKRTPLSEYESRRKGGKIALLLDDDDELVYVRHTSGNDDIIIATKNGNATRFDEKDARPMGRGARGVRGIKLEDGDYVTGAVLVEDDKTLITITENGFGKRSVFDEFACHNRGGKGVCCHNITEKTGLLASIASVSENDDIMLMTSEGTMIRMSADEIPVYRRSAGGVIVMRTSDEAKVASFTVIANENIEIEESSSSAPAAAPVEAEEEIEEVETTENESENDI